MIKFFVGISFVVAGSFILLEIAVPDYQSWEKMKSWQSTSASLIKITSSKDHTKATYRYTPNSHIDPRRWF